MEIKKTKTAPRQPGHKRLQPGERDFQYDLESVLGHPVHMDARRVVDRYLRYERVLQAKSDWIPVDFDGKRVLEIGCGPLLGAGPIAVYLGSTEYICVEPNLQPEVLQSDEIQTRFFLPFFQQLDALFGRGISFDEFLDRLHSMIVIDTLPLEERARSGEPVDVVFSNGVLQHIGDLDSAVNAIQQLSHASTRQFHVVNFTDHGSPPNDPFREIYRLQPAEYFKHDSLLNLKRPSEIAGLFREAGIPVTLIPYIADEPAGTGTMAPYWSRFDASDLAIQIAFFMS